MGEKEKNVSFSIFQELNSAPLMLMRNTARPVMIIERKIVIMPLHAALPPPRPRTLSDETASFAFIQKRFLGPSHA